MSIINIVNMVMYVESLKKSTEIIKKRSDFSQVAKKKRLRLKIQLHFCILAKTPGH